MSQKYLGKNPCRRTLVTTLATRTLSLLTCLFLLTHCNALRPSRIVHVPKLKSSSSRQEQIPLGRKRSVTATAYTSHPSETSGNAYVTACGSRLTPTSNVIAVSRDLERAGYTCGTRVYIVELGRTFIVQDRMHYRWKNKIDIYMGNNRKRALHWGKMKVTIIKRDD